MKRIDLEITAVSPLAIGKQKPNGSVSEADDYISGTVIRGAIAAQILRLSGNGSADLSQNGGDFQKLFLGDRPAIFQNAYLATLPKDDKVITFSEIQVLPTTALSSKNNSGFKTSDPKTSDPKKMEFLILLLIVFVQKPVVIYMIRTVQLMAIE